MKKPNPVAKHMNTFNKPKTVPNKKAEKIAKQLYKEIDEDIKLQTRINNALGGKDDNH